MAWMKRSAWMAMGLGLSLGAPLYAGVEAVGTTSANFLKIPANARPAAMGEAFTALSDDESSLLYNPAGTARVLQDEVSATHIEWFQGIRLEHLGGIDGFGTLGTLGIGISWLQVDDLVRTERVNNDPSDPLGNFREDGTFSPYDVAIAANWAWRPAPRWNTGIGVKILQQSIDTYSGWGLGIDAGAQYTGFLDWLDLGIDLQNLGSSISVGSTSFQQPLTLSFGGAGYFFQRNLVVTMDIDVPSDDTFIPAIGAEYWIAHTLALRAGWRGGYANQPTAGAGFRVGGMQLDYAWQPYTDLGNTQRITATYAFGTPSLGLRVLTPLVAPLGEDPYRVAKLQPDITRPEAAQTWQLALYEADGTQAKVLQGSGAPPDSFSWDGKDESGQVLPDGIILAQLSVNYGGNIDAKSPQVRLELDSTPPQVALTLGPQIVRPGTQNAVLIPARIEIQATDKHGIGGWKLEVRDQSGKLFRAFSGNGQAPQPLIWDGSNGAGLQVESGTSYIFWPYAKDKLGNWGKGEPQAMVVLLKELHFDIASDALFDPGKADVRISAYQQLKDLKDVILKHHQAGTVVDIIGNTDNEPTVHSVYADNKALSMARAKAVIKFLVTLLDMDESILNPVGMGDTHPVASNDSPEGREKNRRVEVIIHAKEYR
jgi:outer membrane protein OmpA-like peptidoglycan-associated protein